MWFSAEDATVDLQSSEDQPRVDAQTAEASDHQDRQTSHSIQCEATCRATQCLFRSGRETPCRSSAFKTKRLAWAEFGKLTKNSKFRDSWIDAITSVVTSSLQGQLDVDNSQVIVSNDERHAFRVILTTGTRYFNGIREFNLYFVEYLRPRDFGDASTTLVLKGLELSEVSDSARARTSRCRSGRFAGISTGR